jgi:hypothetical protein
MTKILSCAAVVGLLVASSSSVFAGGRGASAVTPAAQFNSGSTSPLQPVTTLSGPSRYAPGQQMLNDMPKPAGSTAPGNGAAVYAPGFLKKLP